mgnify:CR=1 FL=1
MKREQVRKQDAGRNDLAPELHMLRVQEEEDISRWSADQDEAWKDQTQSHHLPRVCREKQTRRQSMKYNNHEIVDKTPRHRRMFNGPVGRPEFHVKNLLTGEWHDEHFPSIKEVKRHIDKDNKKQNEQSTGGAE